MDMKNLSRIGSLLLIPDMHKKVLANQINIDNMLKALINVNMLYSTPNYVLKYFN